MRPRFCTIPNPDLPSQVPRKKPAQKIPPHQKEHSGVRSRENPRIDSRIVNKGPAGPIANMLDAIPYGPNAVKTFIQGRVVFDGTMEAAVESLRIKRFANTTNGRVAIQCVAESGASAPRQGEDNESGGIRLRHGTT